MCAGVDSLEAHEDHDACRAQVYEPSQPSVKGWTQPLFVDDFTDQEPEKANQEDSAKDVAAREREASRGLSQLQGFGRGTRPLNQLFDQKGAAAGKNNQRDKNRGQRFAAPSQDCSDR